ncbi:precorrin-6y C5,15-methyltransferase (decarboxylating), CbiE subunit,precorrin-6Y C5,15-methyltransferase (decarboxylating), CbiT subunit [Desulfosporosinus acidiphilus SJ4]|uniref:Precorrin-6y C5,15-methyltransferase (Decarboxylating), CbiE subunit,precorrin-6Y C5,15-methyltransferase (Decarboxylating), CbiT subunit n=1 Tax=Desulfosporosinus acidiphilus (strain DSM 22704 / JCM 16185 / SJ4) TaxID=646529 RepID=I4D6G0_DESAJ|nr:bifunctional cobalt-precorrin-7 (C(5))-methyltransferase/cobalt-precorrin-6B (C(15))-methyltransferase [Desulfosporosinus acidiphilus]AFM41384.1 precorrin-6y C5,15-methyltransferase (decarboxylating), CbiE subunit,precorrin-6Y C5,15-methyltransferase (decarboxylating), CbiT subunit [Desulfosporosinus acidiphilus SJ4]
MLKVIGIGPGRSEWLPPAVGDLVNHCDVLIGGSRALELFPDFPGSQHCLSGDLDSSLTVIKDALLEKKVIGVLVSGDPGFFSLLPRLKKEFPEEQMDVYPGISSLQFAFARAGLPWQEADFVSVHGRDLSLLPPKLIRLTAVLTGGANTPQNVAQFYLDLGQNPNISVGNALAYPEELWQLMDARHLAQEKDLLKNAILILHPDSMHSTDHQFETAANVASRSRIGIPDQEFLRGKVPMTKSEIRVQVLAKAQISKTDTIVDIGAGTGSISIEAAGLAPEGVVYAIENNPEAQALIVANQQKFEVSNLRLIPGTAPDVFAELPAVNVCIIGGSKGRMKDILRMVPLLEGGRVVITAVTLETMSQSVNLLTELNYQDIDIVSLQAVRWQPVQNLHMAQALNPVFILSARKGVR